VREEGYVKWQWMRLDGMGDVLGFSQLSVARRETERERHRVNPLIASLQHT
jgi:hypothetical protein